jgi:hypothetical protein
MQWTLSRFAHLEGQLRELADQHREFKDEPLHLALAYDPGRSESDVHLFELLGNFGRNEVSDEGKLFEVSFDLTRNPIDGLPQRLHLILSNPVEMKAALEQHWPTAEEIRNAVRRGDFEVLHEDETGHTLMDQLR